ncbi:hypothetical protein BO98_01035 [Candidatus Synechococcus spongiarum LMB bulk10D]|nr:hypothetical protein BO98_01035 [Candidatus Synechococcus spongiarum LMB bulk10D]
MLAKEGLQLIRAKAVGHSVEEPSGKLLAPVGEMTIPALVCQLPEVTGPPRTGGGVTGAFHQSFLFQAAQVAAHHLHGDPKLAGHGGRCGLAQPQQDGQRGLTSRCDWFRRHHTGSGHRAVHVVVV